MFGLYYSPLDPQQSPIVLQTASEEAAASIPLVRALQTVLQFFAPEKGVKLTPQGRWPRIVVLAAFEQYAWHGEDYEPFTPRMEEDLPVASMLRALCENNGWLRTANGKALLTKKGRILLSTPSAEIARALWQLTAQQFDWSYLDGYPQLVDVQHGWSFLIWLLMRHGSQWHPAQFYAEAMVTAWPHVLSSVPADEYSTPMRRWTRVVELRAFKRWLWYFGALEIQHRRNEGNRLDEPLYKVPDSFALHWTRNVLVMDGVKTAQ